MALSLWLVKSDASLGICFRFGPLMLIAEAAHRVIGTNIPNPNNIEITTGK
jgi:hypothetical protein